MRETREPPASARRVYLNNAATSWPKPPEVPRAMADFLIRGGANLARGGTGSRDMATLDMATTCRERIADLFGAPGGDPRLVTFTANVTESLNVVLKGFLRPGMRVLSTSMEHNALVRPLRRLESEGVRADFLPCSREGRIAPDLLAEAIAPPGGPRADLVALSQGSNVCGTLQDLEALADVCRASGVPLVVDAAQTGGILDIDASGLGLAALCFTGHKGLMGPQGIGGILWDREFASRVRPLVEGGTGSFSHEERQPEKLPDKFEAGTPNLPGIAGLEAALEWIRRTGVGTIRRREEALGERLLAGLLRIPGLSLLGPQTGENRLPVFAFNLAGWDNGLLTLALSERYGVEGRPSLHCAPLAHRTLGSFPGGALRLSPGYFTTEEEIDLALSALGELAREAPGA